MENEKKPIQPETMQPESHDPAAPHNHEEKTAPSNPAPNPAPEAHEPHVSQPQAQSPESNSYTASVSADKKKPKKPANKAFWLSFVGGVAGAAIVLLLAFVISGFVNGFTATGIQGDVVNINTTEENASLAEAVAQKCLPSVVTLQVTKSSGSGTGSGVVYDMKGNIITNNHVVSDSTEINVVLDGQSYTGTIVGFDASNDLAVVKIDPTGVTLTPMEIGNSDDIKVGEWVMSLGSPFGLDQSVSTGIVSSLYRSTIMQGTSGNTIYTNLIQTDAAINPGNSGGALVDRYGKLIGINSAIVSSSGNNAGVGFAIPSNTAVEIANTLIAGEAVEHATLGVSVTSVTAQIAKANGLPVSQGAYIQSVTAGGAAEKAGLKQGDIIVKIDDDEIDSSDNLILAVRSHKVGDKVKITYYENGLEKTVDATLGTDGGVDPQQNQNNSSSQQNNNPFSNRGNSGNGNSGNGNSGNGNNYFNF